MEDERHAKKTLIRYFSHPEYRKVDRDLTQEGAHSDFAQASPRSPRSVTRIYSMLLQSCREWRRGKWIGKQFELTLGNCKTRYTLKDTAHRMLMTNVKVLSQQITDLLFSLLLPFYQ
ncbi:hypothetical protein AVEN_246371-1 [Araneus ventricosus]|uniref:Uncharacterized protein n=1 Tax=Araneus ventricosus TaxID=182803 RepID=A0A4Y2M4D7_ARAVE|nr:hypothetical protein AVEN_246371-1 [Araneus ventricosus]